MTDALRPRLPAGLGSGRGRTADPEARPGRAAHAGSAAVGICAVHIGQRLAASGISLVHSGQFRVVTSAGPLNLFIGTTMKK